MNTATFFGQMAKLHDTPFFVLDGEGLIVAVNESFATLFQASTADLVGTYLDPLLAENSPTVQCAVDRAQRSNDTGIGAFRMRAKDNPNLHFPYAEIAHRSPSNGQLHIAFRVHRMTEFLLLNAKIDALRSEVKERANSENERRVALDQLRTILDSMDSLVYVSDFETHEVLLINEYGKQTWGDIEGKKCWQSLHAGQTGPCDFCTSEYLFDDNGEPTGVYVWQIKNSLTGKWYECRDQAMRWPDGRFVRMEIATDITQRKAMEDKLSDNLKEKELLLHELSHRTKNNMQMIKALLDLKIAGIKDPRMKAILRETGGRILSMSLVHEKLYQSENLADIDLKSYIRELSEYLIQEFNVEDKDITIDFEFCEPEVRLSLDQSMPCALILAELTTNAIQHAFIGRDKGELRIRLTWQNEKRICITVEDNGRGLPNDFDLDRAKSFGLKIANGLACKQLRGDMTFQQVEGASFRFCFDRQFPPEQT